MFCQKSQSDSNKEGTFSGFEQILQNQRYSVCVRVCVRRREVDEHVQCVSAHCVSV